MLLSSFLNSVAFVYLTDQDFQNTSAVVGIDWNNLPDFDSVKIVKKYLALRVEESHRQVVFQMSDDLRFLESTELDFKLVGTNEEMLAANFQKYFKEHRFSELGKALSKNPNLGEKILSEFDIEKINAHAGKTVLEFMPKTYFDFLHKQSQGLAKVIIKNFEQVSNMIGGFNFGRVILILGETGFGKTNFALNLALNASLGRRCLYVNMEMPLEDITNRLAVLNSQKSFKDLYDGKILLAEATAGIESFGNNLKFTTGFSASVQSIESLMRKEHKKGLHFVIIDYDQKIDLVYSKNVPEWKLLQIAIQRIEDVAKELEVCVILLAQLNREGSISSSHRATFTAHTILNFKRNDAADVFQQSVNAIVVAEKNRHGKKSQAVLLNYNDQNLKITEISTIDYKKQETKSELRV